MPIKRYNGTDWEVVAGAGVQGPQGATGASATTVVTTKGDLLTYDTTAARLAVGNNGDTIVADSSTSTGLRYIPATIQSNPVLNSAFQIWQRGTSITGAGGGVYTADRWNMYAGGQAVTSRQTTGDTTNLPSIQYCARVQRSNGSSDTTAIPFTQSFETINSIPFAGKTVTLSFYARRGANYSATSNALQFYLVSGTGTDQSVVGTYTGATNQISSTATLTTTWQRFTATVTLPATINELALYFNFAPTGTAGAADFFEITGVQLDIGSVALPFRTYAGTIQGELAACQRYFANVVPSTADYGTVISMFQATSGSTAKGGIRFPVPMRTSASITLANANNFTLANASYTPIGGSSFTYAIGNTVDCRIDMSVASGLTAGNATALSGNTANLLIQASAEL